MDQRDETQDVAEPIAEDVAQSNEVLRIIRATVAAKRDRGETFEDRFRVESAGIERPASRQ